MSTYKAHIFKQRNVGEREEVKLKIFGPDGEELELGGGGGGAGDGVKVAYQGYVRADGVDAASPDFVMATFGEQHDYVEGIDPPDGAEIDVPAGLYAACIQPNWNWPLSPAMPPDEGIASARISFETVDMEGDLVGFTLNTQYENNNGAGDAPFGGGIYTKVGIAAIPVDGKISCRVFQSASVEEAMNFTATVAFARL